MAVAKMNERFDPKWGCDVADYSGLSTDDKPTVLTKGSRFFEKNATTGEMTVYHSSSKGWVAQSSPVAPVEVDGLPGNVQADIGTIQDDIALIKADVATEKADLAELKRLQQAGAYYRMEGADTYAVSGGNPAYALGIMFDSTTVGTATIKNGDSTVQVLPVGMPGGQFIPLMGVKFTTSIVVVLAGADNGAAYFIPVN